MWSHVRESRNDYSNQVQHILALSFKDLPYRLKLCFLYLGLFPEDLEIDAHKLCRLWMAEGFIEPGEESFEEKAEAYLRELIDRSLIQVAEWNWRRIIKCRVHDLLRDFAIDKSKELNFFHIYEGTIAPNSRSRRLASYSGGPERFISLDLSDMRLRTLLFYNLEDQDVDIALLQPLCRKLRLLRVLGIWSDKFKEVDFTRNNKLPDEIGNLIHLRFLGLCDTNMNVLSQFVGNLHVLQTLELNINDPIQLPDEICEAKQLRHLIGCFEWPFPVDNLTNLRTLGTVYVNGQMEFNPTDLINLRELKVRYRQLGGNTMPDNIITLDSIGGLRNLHTLEIRVDWTAEVRLHPLSHCQDLIQLRLFSFYKAVTWKLPTEGLQNLRCLQFIADGLKEDPMPVLEKLPKLTILMLRDYGGTKLVCTAGGFPRLEILQFIDCIKLEEIQVEGGGMPVLKGLYMQCCDNDIMMPERLCSIPAPNPVLDEFEWAY